MTFNRTMKIKYGGLLLITSIFLGGLFIATPKTNTKTVGELQTSALTLDPISILIYNEYADLVQEFENTITAIDTYYGSNYNYDNLTDSTNLGSMISNYDVLLIPEQENANSNQMKTDVLLYVW